MDEDNEKHIQDQCYNFQGVKKFLKRYKSKLQRVHSHRHDHSLHFNRSGSFELHHNLNFKANNEKNQESHGVKKLGKIGEKELNKKSVKHGNNYQANNDIISNNNNKYHNTNNKYSCFNTIILLHAPKKKQPPSKVSAADVPHNISSIEDDEKSQKTPSRATSFDTKPSIGRSRSINNSNKSQQQWAAKTPSNSRTASINRTSSFSNGGIRTPPTVTRSTSMSICRSKSKDNVVLSSFRSFNKSRTTDHVIMFSNSKGVLKPPAMEQELQCTLEELCYGCVKKITVSRDFYSSTGQITQEDEVLTVNIKPGWKAGTKITFEGNTSNEHSRESRADVVFIIGEKPHSVFQRKGDDLEMEMEIPLVDALTGCNITIPLLRGEKITMAIDDIIVPGYEKVIVGRGMPNQKNIHHRGDLKVKFLVDFPKRLTEEQRENAFRIFSGVVFES